MKIALKTLTRSTSLHLQVYQAHLTLRHIAKRWPRSRKTRRRLQLASQPRRLDLTRISRISARTQTCHSPMILCRNNLPIKKLRSLILTAAHQMATPSFLDPRPHPVLPSQSLVVVESSHLLKIRRSSLSAHSALAASVARNTSNVTIVRFTHKTNRSSATSAARSSLAATTWHSTLVLMVAVQS